MQNPCLPVKLANSYQDFSLNHGVEERQAKQNITEASYQHGQLQDLTHITVIDSVHPQFKPNTDLVSGGHSVVQEQNLLLPESSHTAPVAFRHQQHVMQAHQQLMHATSVDALRQSPLLRRAPNMHHHPSIGHHQSIYGNHQYSDYAAPQQHSRKRSRAVNDLHLELHGLQDLQDPNQHDLQELTSHNHHQSQPSLYTPQSAGPQSSQLPPPQHHHHRLPNHEPPTKMRRLGYDSPPLQQHGPPSVVGHEGMPPPAPRPRGPKLKFTPEDDQLLVDLKEKKNLTWKQIADFFPGRSSGTLQVRYCTKLKAKTTVWTDEMVSHKTIMSCVGFEERAKHEPTPGRILPRWLVLICLYHRSKSCAMLYENMKMIVGALYRQRSVMASRLLHARKRRSTFLV